MSAEAKQYRVAQVSRGDGPFEIVERPIPTPGNGQVLIKVEACGLCHSDTLAKSGRYPGLTYPRVPGHEVVGRVVKVGEQVPRFQVGQRVGQGWYAGHCNACNPCIQQVPVLCATNRVTGITLDGGYGEYMLCPWEALAMVPEELDSAEAAPLLCAGLTVYNGMRNAGLKPNDLVAVQGIGGLGHLAIQFARHMGFRVVALSTSDDKKDLATELGAHFYINVKTQNAVEELNRLGGAKAIVATAFDAKSMTALIDGLGIDGVLLVVGASPEAIQVTPLQLIMGRRRIMGWLTGTGKDAEETLQFAATHNIRARIETLPIEQIEQGYGKMMTNKARFRMVLVHQHKN